MLKKSSKIKGIKNKNLNHVIIISPEEVSTKIRLIYSLQPKMEKLNLVRKSRPGADSGSDHELLTAKFRIILKKAGKTTRPFRYDLNQIPYDYIV